jgi:hypothetical protein
MEIANNDAMRECIIYRMRRACAIPREPLPRISGKAPSFADDRPSFTA